MKHRLIVRQHAPKRQIVIWLSVALAALAAAAALFEWGRIQGGYQRADSQRELTLMGAELNAATERNAELRQQVALLERSRQIDAQAIEELRGALEEQESEVQNLREELAFYQGIVSPSDGRAGLQIQRLDLEGVGGAVTFELVLIQAMDHERTVSGRAQLSLVTRDPDGAEVVLGMAEAVPAQPEGIPFSFRYYQVLEGDIAAPEGLTVESVRVTLVPAGRGRSNITEEFDWDVQR